MSSVTHHAASIPSGEGALVLPADLSVPRDPAGLVVLAHGCGSRKDSARNLLVSAALEAAGFATLRVDLVGEFEARDPHTLFDAELLATRLAHAARWAAGQTSGPALPLGYFGSSTGAATAFVAAARDPKGVAAIVTAGGRPDMAFWWLPRILAPTLFIVGQLDEKSLDWNRDAYQRIQAEKALTIIPGATHLFAEAGTLEQAAEHARRWFVRHLRREPALDGATGNPQGPAPPARPARRRGQRAASQHGEP